MARTVPPVLMKKEFIRFRKAFASRTTPWSDDELKLEAGKSK